MESQLGVRLAGAVSECQPLMPVGAAPPGAFGQLAAVDRGFSREGSNPLSASCCLQGARGGGRLPRDPPLPSAESRVPARPPAVLHRGPRA